MGICRADLYLLTSIKLVDRFRSISLQRNSKTMTPINYSISPELKQSCEDYDQYIQAILQPAMRQLQRGINAEKVELHQIFGANLFIAHVVDYIQAIRRADGIKETRVNLVKKFDQVFSVPGARIGNRKIELIDAVNNALKHIRLDPTRYKELEQHYGPISFQSLVQEGERNRPDFYRLFFDSEKYYCS